MMGHQKKYKRRQKVSSVLVTVKYIRAGNNKNSPTNISLLVDSGAKYFHSHKLHMFIYKYRKTRLHFLTIDIVETVKIMHKWYSICVIGWGSLKKFGG